MTFVCKIPTPTEPVDMQTLFENWPNDQHPACFAAIAQAADRLRISRSAARDIIDRQILAHLSNSISALLAEGLTPDPANIEARMRDRRIARRLNDNFRNAVGDSLRGTKNRMKTFQLLGYSVADLRSHLEALFVDGMDWETYGAAWHVDHIRPLASFRITGVDCPEFKAAWALSNLQPLWARDNLRKGARWKPDEITSEANR